MYYAYVHVCACAINIYTTAVLLHICMHMYDCMNDYLQYMIPYAWLTVYLIAGANHWFSAYLIDCMHVCMPVGLSGWLIVCIIDWMYACLTVYLIAGVNHWFSAYLIDCMHVCMPVGLSGWLYEDINTPLKHWHGRSNWGTYEGIQFAWWY